MDDILKPKNFETYLSTDNVNVEHITVSPSTDHCNEDLQIQYKLREIRYLDGPFILRGCEMSSLHGIETTKYIDTIDGKIHPDSVSEAKYFKEKMDEVLERLNVCVGRKLYLTSPLRFENTLEDVGAMRMSFRLLI